jgi:D-alanyl-D-alanine carboxypeptidase (penicillin-binding protein 5/6)
MAAPDHKVRFTEAQALLDYGFANCSIYEDTYENMNFEQVTVKRGIPSAIQVYPKEKFVHTFTSEYDEAEIKKEIQYNDLTAPIKKGDEIGFITYSYQGTSIGSVPLLSLDDSEKASYTDLLLRSIRKLFQIETA